MPAVPLSAGTVIADRLQVIRPLGEGGMGSVYEVEHLVTKHRRAMKLLRPELSERASLRERLQREASAAGRIGNPHIVETFDTGELDDGSPYLLMELLRGRSLAAWLKADGRLPAAVASNIVIQACDGLEAAHQAGIVHRDVKPDNLFIVGDEPFVKLVDFGISRFDPDRTFEHALTVEGTPIGTPFYMPPEQVRGEATITPQADVYSLGVVLYECVTGRRPFEAASLPELGVRIHQGRYTPATELVSSLPKRLDTIIARALALEPDQRYPSARAFAEDLERLAKSEPLPQPAPRGPEPHSRRFRWALGIAAALVLGGLALRFAARTQRPPDTSMLAAPATAATPAAPATSAGLEVASEPVHAEPRGASDAALPTPQARARASQRRNGKTEPKAGPTRASEHKLEERDPF